MDGVQTKKTVYALSAVCAAAYVAIIAVRFGIRPELLGSLQPSVVLSIVLEIGMILGLIVMAVLRVSGKPMPRLTLMLAGAAAFSTLSALANGMFECLLPLAAGLLPAAYELTLYGRAVKGQPVRPVKSGLLVAAGVLALLYGGKVLIDAVREMDMYATAPSFAAVLPYQALADRAGAVICALSLGVFCLLKDRRTSVMYCLFFAGLLAEGALRLPLIAVAQLQSGEMDFLATALLMLPAVALVLVHAARRRQDGDILPAPEDTGTKITSPNGEDDEKMDLEE